MIAMYWIDRNRLHSSGRDVLLVGAEQRAGHRGERARHRERADLVAAEPHADDLGGDVAVADRLHRAAGPRAHEVLGQQRDDRDEPPDQPEEALVARVVLDRRRLEVGEVDRAELALGASTDVPELPPVTSSRLRKRCSPRKTSPSVTIAR